MTFPAVSREKTQVIYIAGMGRSGSTILGRLLGELPNAVHVGELGLFTSPQFQAVARCECLKTVGECDFWQAVFERAFGGLNALDLEALQETRREYRLRGLPFLLRPRTVHQTRRLREYLAVLGALYGAVREISGASVIIDGSKEALYGYLLQQVPAINLHPVHLIRDSRAVAFSYQRVKKHAPLPGSIGELPRYPPWQTALAWSAVTLLLGAARDPRPVRLRYEDFVADPRSTLLRLWELTREPMPSLDFLNDSPLSLHQGHTVAGNPDRFQSEVVLKPDLEWQRKMRPRDRSLVTALTFPLLCRYGYLRPLPRLKQGDRNIQPSCVL